MADNEGNLVNFDKVILTPRDKVAEFINRLEKGEEMEDELDQIQGVMVVKIFEADDLLEDEEFCEAPEGTETAEPAIAGAEDEEELEGQEEPQEPEEVEIGEQPKEEPAEEPTDKEEIDEKDKETDDDDKDLDEGESNGCAFT